MSTYIIKRLLISVFIVFVVSVFSFSLIQVMPGDPARLALGFEASEEDVQALREEMNLDKPVLTQYTLWIKGLFKGDLGQSVIYKQPVSNLLAERLPRTIFLGLPALLLAAPIGILIGIVCAVRRGKLSDQLLTFLMTLGIGMPVFWLGIIGIYVFAVWLRVLPMTGYTSPLVNFGDYVRKAI